MPSRVMLDTYLPTRYLWLCFIIILCTLMDLVIKVHTNTLNTLELLPPSPCNFLSTYPKSPLLNSSSGCDCLTFKILAPINFFHQAGHNLFVLPAAE